MDHFAGLDVSVKETSVCIVDDTGNPSDRLGHPFLVDANLMPGNSGGPVFHVPTGVNRFGEFSIGGKLSLIGIVSKGPEQNVNIHVGKGGRCRINSGQTAPSGLIGSAAFDPKRPFSSIMP